MTNLSIKYNRNAKVSIMNIDILDFIDNKQVLIVM